MKNLSKTETRINAQMGKAINDYDLISEGDRILVAVSGGKDSLVMLNMLRKIASWAPVTYKIFAAHITTDLECGNHLDREAISRFCSHIGVDLFFSHVNVLDHGGNTNCFWCSWNKRKALFEIAEMNGFDKVALGHHKDDIVETIMLNMFYKGEISTINPKQLLFNGKLSIIRPMCYVDDSLLKSCALESGLLSSGTVCKFGKSSKRTVVREILSVLEKDTPGMCIKTNIFNSLTRVKKDYMGLKTDKN